MRLNEDLTEAIALGHDLGHSPFGHCGERTLNEICPHGFKHYEQSVRVVEVLEKKGKGLNLTHAVRNGILCHTNMVADTKEGNIVRLADTIAYINHDIEDSIRAGILSPNDLPRSCVIALGNTKTKRITTLIASVIGHGAVDIDFAPDIRKAHDELKRFMFEKVYTNPSAKQEEGKAEQLVRKLYAYFIEHTDKLPEEYRNIIKIADPDRAVCDYISGMSDEYAVDLYTELFVPKFWK
jgi:dGTPase